SAKSSRRELVANNWPPTINGVPWGPAPSEKSTPSVGAEYLNSQMVFPVAASSAATTSSWLCRALVDRPPTGLYIVYNRSPSTRIDECPSPRARAHSFLGPPGGHVDASPFESEMKLRCGPPHC